MNMRSPSARYTSGVVYRLPDLAPVVVNNTMGAPLKPPPTLPSLARNSEMICWLKLLMAPLYCVRPVIGDAVRTLGTPDAGRRGRRSPHRGEECGPRRGGR